MRDDRNDPERDVYLALSVFMLTKDPSGNIQDSRTAKIDALCDKLELQMMGISSE